jgi:RNA-directed DNA polymerase
VVSPTLANIYLHYAFDLWAERCRHHEAHGNVIYVRYADDIVAAFEHESDAVRFLAEPRERLEKFALSLHPDKTRLIEFGCHAADNQKKRGLGKPETFNFLGFTHICGRSRAGYFQLKRKTRRDRMRVKLKALIRRTASADACSDSGARALVGSSGTRIFRVSRGAHQCSAAGCVRYHVTILWHRTLRRRSQKDWTSWERISHLVATYLPPVRILHP